MSLDSWVQIILAVATVCAALVAVIALRKDRRDKAASVTEERIRKLSQEEQKSPAHEVRIRELAHQEYEPLKDRLQEQAIRLGQAGDRLGRIEDMLKELADMQRSFADRLAGIDVKVELYWTTMAMNAAKNLHQPDPRRASVDRLLEAFMEGTLTADERIELKKILVQIRNYEPGKSQLDFPVMPGEQTSAAILLSTMDLVDPGRMPLLGHASHRSPEP